MDWLARAGWVLLLAGMVSAAIDCTVAFEGGEAEFDTCQSIMGGAKLFYSFVGDEVDMAFQDGYFAFGFPERPGQMTGAGSVSAIAHVSPESEPFVGDYTLRSKSTAGVQVIDGLRSVVPGTLQYMTASGSASSSPSMLRRHTSRFYGSTQLLEGENGDVDSGEVLPLPNFDRYINVFNAHGALMVTAWIFLIPLGIIMARYFRQKTDHWFNIHRIVQGSAVVISLASFILALVESNGGSSTAHLAIGIIVTAFSLLTAVAATFLRPVKGSRRRKQFNIFHRVGAAVMFALAVANCYIGQSLLADFTDTTAFLVVISVGLGVMVLAEIATLILIPRFDPADEKADNAESSPSSHTEDPSSHTEDAEG